MFDARADVMPRGIRNGFGAYGALEFYGASNKRLCFTQTEAAAPENEWTRLAVTSVAPPDVATVRWCLVVNGVGEGYFTAAALACTGNIAPKPLSGPVTITVTDKQACKAFQGFGAEDDGWFYGPANAEHGVTGLLARTRSGRPATPVTPALEQVIIAGLRLLGWFHVPALQKWIAHHDRLYPPWPVRRWALALIKRLKIRFPKDWRVERTNAYQELFLPGLGS